MIKFDFNTYAASHLEKEVYQKNYLRKDEIFRKFDSSDMIGWTRKIQKEEIRKILNLRDEIKDNAECLVVIGIGGSYLGSLALNDIFDNNFKVIYLGNNLSSRSINDTFKYLEDKNFYVDVISKSGNTMEVLIAYSLVREFMIKKYSEDEIEKRIIITTNDSDGKLREEVDKYSYRSFVVPSDIGGRYSLITAAHLLPVSFNIDIEKLIDGFMDGLNLKEEAYSYACCRKTLYDTGKLIENFSVYEPSFNYFLEWIKQLFGESEGKEKKGVFPVGTIGTRDLHSLGQFIQDGNPIIFETFIKIDIVGNIKYRDIGLDKINNLVLDSVVDAHFKSKVYSNVIEIDCVSDVNIGRLCAFFMLSAAYSGYLFDVNPFNQPGVEVYKKCVRSNLSEVLK